MGLKVCFCLVCACRCMGGFVRMMGDCACELCVSAYKGETLSGVYPCVSLDVCDPWWAGSSTVS